MQFRVQGKRLQVFRSKYDPTPGVKRNVAFMVTSMLMEDVMMRDGFEFAMNALKPYDITKKEADELKEWVNAAHQKRLSDDQKQMARKAEKILGDLIEIPDAVWEAEAGDHIELLKFMSANLRGKMSAILREREPKLPAPQAIPTTTWEELPQEVKAK